jgi:predicted adenylyl cyclase CyaB
MEEIEVKVLDVQAEAIVRRLVERGARLEIDLTLHALYFDTANRELSGRGDSLRLRREGDRVLLNYKAHRSDHRMKVKDEYETTVGDLGTARDILLGLGYVVWFEIQKRRRSYTLPDLRGVHFELDRFLGAHAYVPEFLEIEAPTRELLQAGVAAAGFSMEQTVPWNAFHLVEHYRKAGGRGE